MMYDVLNSLTRTERPKPVLHERPHEKLGEGESKVGHTFVCPDQESRSIFKVKCDYLHFFKKNTCKPFIVLLVEGVGQKILE